MKKFYSVLFLVTSFNLLNAQLCPVIYGALINACSTTSPTSNEGLNEFVVFRTTEQTTVSNYKFYYGSNNPATTSPSAVLSGATATAKNGTGVITNLGGCTLVYVTSGATVIPANAPVVFIPSNFTNNFDITPFCTTGTFYVVLIDITNAANTWNANGTFANSPGANFRYLQVNNGVSACTPFVRAYTSGWASNVDGNFVAWDITGTASYFNGGCDLLVVPLKLTSFSATGAGNNANIVWQTANEVNTRTFEIQRSSDGISFATIGTYDAAGHSNDSKNYAFTDMDIPSGVNYYRLKIVDLDGKLSYSSVAKVTNSRKNFVITNVYPKPAISHVNFTWNSPRAGNTTANVFDLAGRMVISKKMATAPGMNYYQLAVSSLPRGEYLLKLSKDGETVVTKFTRQ